MSCISEELLSYEPQKLRQEIGHIMKIVTVLVCKECYENLLEKGSCKELCRVRLVCLTGEEQKVKEIS